MNTTPHLRHEVAPKACLLSSCRLLAGLLLITGLMLCPGFAQLPAGEKAKPELLIQAGHAAPVVAIAFSPDGRLLASGSIDTTIKLWETTTWRELRTFSGHTAPVRWVAFSPDGRWLASGANDKTVRLWNLGAGREWRTLAGHGAQVASVAFSPDGRWLASGGADKTLKLWDVATGRELRTIPGHAGGVEAIAFSPDGRWLASGGSDKTVKIWDAGTGRELRTLTGHTAPVQWVVFSPDGGTLASAAEDKTVRLWEAGTGRETRTLVGHTGSVFSLAFSPDGRWLASGSRDRTTRLWEVATGREARTFVDKSYPVLAVAFSPDGYTLASAGGESTIPASFSSVIRLWEAGTGREVSTLVGKVGVGVATGFSSDGRWLISENLEKNGVTGKFMELDTGKLYEMTTDVSISDQGPQLVLPKLLEGFQFLQKHKLRVPNAAISSGPMDADGKTMWACFAMTGAGGLAVANGQTIRLWNIATGPQPRTLAGHTATITAIAFGPGGRLLVSRGEDKTLRFWDVTTGQEVRSLANVSGLSNWPAALTFSPDGRWLAAGSENNVKLWETATGREIRTLAGHAGAVKAVAFSADGRRLASAGLDRQIKLWAVDTGEELRTVASQSTKIFCLAFSPDGRTLTSQGVDGSIHLWDPATGEEIAVLVHIAQGTDWLVTTPQGLFDGTEQGMQRMVVWKIGNRTYPPDRFFADFYTPGLLRRILAGERPRPNIDLADLKVPPDVRFASPGSGSKARQARLVADIEVTDLGSGVAEVRLYQNGKLVNGDAGPPRTTYKLEVDLVPGENVLKAVALSKEGVESNEDSVRVFFEAPQQTRPTLHLLVVGVNQYEDPSFNLGFARQDGEALARFFGQRGGRLFGAVKTIKLFDKEATQPAIRKALGQLAEQARPEDVVLFYLAGHGVGLGQQFYFLPHEMRKEEDDQAAIRKYGIPALVLSEGLRRIPALKQVLILDTCQSETALPILAKVAMFRGMSLAEERATKMLARSNGVYLIAASTKQQYALEVPELGHGVLTYALLSALGEQGQPQAAANAEGIVTMLSILQHVNQQVPELTEKYQEGNKQYPVSFSTGMDFPLLVR